MEGTVSHFDRQVGLGTVRATDRTTFGFHCIRIADGTRDIAVGTAVSFEIIAGLAGRWEATALVSLPDSPD